MPQVTIRGRNGRTRQVDIGNFDGDLNALLQDGETITVPTMLMDDLRRGYAPAADATADAVTAGGDRQGVEDARDGMINRTSNRWRGDAKQQQTPVADASVTAYDQYMLRLSNAWRVAR